VFVSVEQTGDGRHKFISLTVARRIILDGSTLSVKMFGEDIVKANVEASGSIMVFARPENETFTPMQNRRTSSGLKVWENFSICPEVSLGPNQKLILCDENTLKQTQGSPIFDSLTLIVNCH
jgi:hypothetical protein